MIELRRKKYFRGEDRCKVQMENGLFSLYLLLGQIVMFCVVAMDTWLHLISTSTLCDEIAS